MRYDSVVQSIRSDEPYVLAEFVLKDKDGNEHLHRGVYLIVDNGYRQVMKTLTVFRFADGKPRGISKVPPPPS